MAILDLPREDQKAFMKDVQSCHKEAKRDGAAHSFMRYYPDDGGWGITYVESESGVGEVLQTCCSKALREHNAAKWFGLGCSGRQKSPMSTFFLRATP